MVKNLLFSRKRTTKGFTLVEIIVVLVILAVLAVATIPSMLGFVDDAKKKSLTSEVRAVHTAAQAYATERFAQGDSDTEIQTAITGLIDPSHKLYYLLQNDATGTIFNVEVKDGKVEKFSYAKDTIKDIQADYAFNLPSIQFTKFNPSDPALSPSSIINASSTITNIEDIKSDLVDLIYPVGSVYTSFNSTSPKTLFGGEWTKIVNEFLYCVDPDSNDSSVAAGTTGGDSSHTHTTNGHVLQLSEIPSHNHSFTGTTATGSFKVRHLATDSMNIVDFGLGVFSISNRGSDSTSNYGVSSTSHSAKDDVVSFSMTPSGSVSNAGSGNSHSHGDTGSASNMPPYMRVYCWRRTE